jgi:hypothetical protein
MEEETLSPEESLRVIQAMINKAKETVADNSYYFLLWGWLVFIACLGQFVLKVIFNSPYHPVVWSINILGIVFSIIHGVRQEKKQVVKSYIDAALDYLWLSVVLLYILFGFAFARIGWQNCYTFYMLLYGLGSFVTGKLLKFPALVWGAAASWLLAIVTTFTNFDVNILLCAASIAVCYIIPGYLLKAKYKTG